MVFAALLLIIAILLFGASAIFGAITAIIGFIAAAAALAVAIYHSSPLIASMGFSASDAPWLIILIICAIFAIGRLAIYVFDGRR